MIGKFNFSSLGIDVDLDIRFEYQEGIKGKTTGDPSLCYPAEPDVIGFDILLSLSRTKFGASAQKVISLDDELAQKIFSFIEDKIMDEIKLEKELQKNDYLIEKKIRGW